MRGTPVSEKYRGTRSDGIIYRALTKYRGIPSDGTDFQYAYEYIMTQFISSHPHIFCHSTQITACR